MDIEKLTPIQDAIVKEISRHLRRLGAEVGLCAAINSWGDTLPEYEVWLILKEMFPDEED